MDAITYLKKQINSMQYLQDSVLKGLADETMNQIPPGTVSPIGIIWLHMVNAEDTGVPEMMLQIGNCVPVTLFSDSFRMQG